MDKVQVPMVGEHVPVQGDEVCPVVPGEPEMQIRGEVDGEGDHEQRDWRPTKIRSQTGARLRRIRVVPSRMTPEKNYSPADSKSNETGQSDAAPFRRHAKPDEKPGRQKWRSDTLRGLSQYASESEEGSVGENQYEEIGHTGARFHQVQTVHQQEARGKGARGAARGEGQGKKIGDDSPGSPEDHTGNAPAEWVIAGHEDPAGNE